MGWVLINIIPAMGFGFIFQLIIHEVGHLIGGLISGWRFLYLQIYRLVIKWENKWLNITTTREVGCKCIMYPKSINQAARLYTMGGYMLNLISSVIGLFLLIFASISPVMWLYIWSFVAFGIGLFFMNGIASIKRVCNDKACYNLIKADKHNKLCHNAQLITARHLINGLTYSEIGEEILCLCPEVAENDIQAYQAILEYYYFLDNNNILKVGQALNKIRNKNNISGNMLRLVDMELIYIRLICGIHIHNKNMDVKNSSDTENTKRPWLNDAEAFFNIKQKDIHFDRVKAVYDAYTQYANGSSEKAIVTLNKALYLMEKSNFIYGGEKEFCIKQLLWVKKIMEYEEKEAK
ncbi:MAG: hypothetical protein GX129_02190 [Clostridiales bacterium]|nr:hypothetical protein [Clostridiales bacterium]